MGNTNYLTKDPKIGLGYLSRHIYVVLMPLVAIAIAAAPRTARAKTITVNTLTDEAIPGDRLCSLREAINNANSASDTTDGDCAAGTGDDLIDFKVEGTITLTSALPDISQALTIDGGGQITIDGAFFQVLVVNSGATLAVDNLTIENGVASFPTFVGGGIDDEGGTLSVSNSTFSSNFAGMGGGIAAEGGTLTVSNSNFFGNFADIGGCGGAIFNNAPLTVTGGTFSGNHAIAGSGGAICGGGTIINSSFSGNGIVEPGPGHFGGAIFGTVPLNVTNSTFSGNVVRNGAGGAIIGEGTVTNSTFSGNAAIFSGFGGAIAGDMTVTNSTFSSNSAVFEGGAIDGGGTVTNSTFFGNSAFVFGGGAISGSATVSNSILGGSTSGGNCGGFGTLINGGNNISDDDTCAFGTATAANGATIGDNADPLVDPNGLQNNGGPTQTIALQPGSPAIDAIPAANCPATDQRGVPRPDNFETACDIGSYEFFDFAGTPGQGDCRGDSISALNKQFGKLTTAASDLGFPSVKVLKAAIQTFCGG